MTKFIASAALALSFFAAPVHAITNNWVEDFEHPYVGLVVFYDSAGQFIWRCSGSLIDPRTVLTAGHCADTAEGAASARVYFQQDAGARFNGTEDPVTGYPNVWLGVTVENKKHGLPRIHRLRSIPAAVRFLSMQPLLEDLGSIDLQGIDWVIAGAESGSAARTMRPAWLTAIQAQCRKQRVPCFSESMHNRSEPADTCLLELGTSNRRKWIL